MSNSPPLFYLTKIGKRIRLKEGNLSKNKGKYGRFIG
jgi:hypothetical protein